jgi:hypothetical protein
MHLLYTHDLFIYLMWCIVYNVHKTAVWDILMTVYLCFLPNQESAYARSRDRCVGEHSPNLRGRVIGGYG